MHEGSLGNSGQNSERSDEVSSYLTVSCGQVPGRKLHERMFADSVPLFNLTVLASPLCLCIDVCPSHTTHAQPISAARMSVEAPYLHVHSPLLASKAVLSSWSLVMICPPIARGKFKPELEFQAGTISYHAQYKYENIEHVHMYSHLQNT